MSHPQPPSSAKLVLGLLLKRGGPVREAAYHLMERFGPVEMVSRNLSFEYTSYYEPEMGSPLFRRMVVFKKPIQQAELPLIKVFTNSLELKLSRNGKRTINIDPGYLLLERFVLATGKNFAHRIYLDKGIYADLTLIFQNGFFQPLPWTYPDYADKPIGTFLKKARDRIKADLKMVKK